LSPGDRNSHVLVAQIVVHGRREETKFRQPRKMGDAMYHTIFICGRSTLHHLVSPLLGAIIQF